MAGFPLGGGSRSRSRDDPPPPIPLAVPSDSSGGFLYTTRGGFQLWQQQQVQEQEQHQFYASNIIRFADDPAAGAATGSASRSARGAAGVVAGSVSCQDCGNQAKKDCAHLRCRTCCKSRGFDCPTHVKSTWVPAAKRRERQHQLTALATPADPSKRPRDGHALRSSITPTTSSEDQQQMMLAERFPREVNTEAVFRCVRLGPVDEADAEVAYQTAVSIGGHVFKGILHDVGPDPSGGGEHHLIRHAGEGSSPSTAAAGEGHAVASSAVVMDPYPTPGPFGAFTTGSQFFHSHPR